MSLIICPECGKEYSDRASACPNCACPTPLPHCAESCSDSHTAKTRSIIRPIIITIVIIVIALNSKGGSGNGGGTFTGGGSSRRTISTGPVIHGGFGGGRSGGSFGGGFGGFGGGSFGGGGAGGRF